MRLAAFNYFNVSIYQRKEKNSVHSMREICRRYFTRHRNEIDHFLKRCFNGPKLKLPKKILIKIFFVDSGKYQIFKDSCNSN